jgi:hypothetical protein
MIEQSMSVFIYIRSLLAQPLSRVLGLPVIVVRGVLWLAGFLVLASIAYIIHFSWEVLL